MVCHVILKDYTADTGFLDKSQAHLMYPMILVRYDMLVLDPCFISEVQEECIIKKNSPYPVVQH